MASDRSVMDARQTRPVTLNIYDVGSLTDSIGAVEVQALNKVLRKFGTGAFHCGVEVYGQEWSFKYEAFRTGVFYCTPRHCEEHTFSESLPMGQTIMTPKEVLRVIDVLQEEWSGDSYDSLRRNCCHFTDQLCNALGVGSIPSWTMHLAGTGAALVDTSDYLEERLRSAQGSWSLACPSFACNVPAMGNPSLQQGREYGVELELPNAAMAGEHLAGIGYAKESERRKKQALAKMLQLMEEDAGREDREVSHVLDRSSDDCQRQPAWSFMPKLCCAQQAPRDRRSNRR